MYLDFNQYFFPDHKYLEKYVPQIDLEMLFSGPNIIRITTP